MKIIIFITTSLLTIYIYMEDCLIGLKLKDNKLIFVFNLMNPLMDFRVFNMIYNLYIIKADGKRNVIYTGKKKKNQKVKTRVTCQSKINRLTCY